MSKWVYRTAYAVLGLFVAGVAFGQLLVPVVATDMAMQFPEVSHLVVPYSFFGILALGCMQAVAVMFGVLLRRAAKGGFFCGPSRRWIKRMSVVATVGFLIPVGVGVHLLVSVGSGGPGVLLGIIAACGGAVGFACLGVIALRAFDTTSAEHYELGEVI